MSDNDCMNGGRCEMGVSTHHPMNQCYCSPGWFGRHCEKGKLVCPCVVWCVQLFCGVSMCCVVCPCAGWCVHVFCSVSMCCVVSPCVL